MREKPPHPCLPNRRHRERHTHTQTRTRTQPRAQGGAHRREVCSKSSRKGFRSERVCVCVCAAVGYTTERKKKRTTRHRKRGRTREGHFGRGEGRRGRHPPTRPPDPSNGDRGPTRESESDITESKTLLVPHPHTHRERVRRLRQHTHTHTHMYRGITRDQEKKKVGGTHTRRHTRGQRRVRAAGNAQPLSPQHASPAAAAQERR